MANREVEIIITSAKDLKNVNWRYGRLKPYAVAWIDRNNKTSTRVDESSDTNPYWDQTLMIPLNAPIDDSTLYIDIVHVGAVDDTKPLIGSARLTLRDVVDDVGFGQRATRTLDLKRPSGRPQGKLEVKVSVRELRYNAPDPYYAPSHGSGYQTPPGPYVAPYGGQTYGQPQSGYGQPSQTGLGQVGYGPPMNYGRSGYGSGQPIQEAKTGSKFGGIGTGLAVGAVAGVLGGLALAEGAEYMEDKIADKAAEKVEEDNYDGDGDGDGGW